MMSLNLSPLIYFFIDCFISNGIHILSHHVFNIFSYIVYKNVDIYFFEELKNVDIWCESMDVVQNISYKKVRNNKFHLSVSGLSWNNPIFITYKC